jgi:hypothetical protein
MTAKHTYNFTLLRYVHDVASGEFVNMGIVLFAPDGQFLKAMVRKSYGRLTHFFPGADGEHIKRTVSAVESRINLISGDLKQAKLAFAAAESRDALTYATRVLPNDDSALQWSEIQGGLTDDPAKTVNRLFDRFVKRYDVKPTHERRSDDQVWREFSKRLEVRRLLDCVQEHDISSPVETVHFKHALKNGRWHVLEPISFDLMSGDYIKRKAKELLGQLSVLKDSARSDFKVYMLVGEPKQGDVQRDYETALRYLKQVPVEHEIYTESDAESFATEIQKVMAHA